MRIETVFIKEVVKYLVENCGCNPNINNGEALKMRQKWVFSDNKVSY